MFLGGCVAGGTGLVLGGTGLAALLKPLRGGKIGLRQGAFLGGTPRLSWALNTACLSLKVNGRSGSLLIIVHNYAVRLDCVSTELSVHIEIDIAHVHTKTFKNLLCYKAQNFSILTYNMNIVL